MVIGRDGYSCAAASVVPASIASPVARMYCAQVRRIQISPCQPRRTQSSPSEWRVRNARHSSRDRHFGKGGAQFRLLHPRSWAALREENGQLRRPNDLSPLLRRRGRAPGDGPHVLRLGARGAGPRRDWPGAANRVSRARKLDGLLDASLRRTGRRPRANRKALWRVGAPICRSRRDASGIGRRSGCRERAGMEEPRCSGRACDPRISRRDADAGRGCADRCAPDRRAAVFRDRTRGRRSSLQGQ